MNKNKHIIVIVVLIILGILIFFLTSEITVDVAVSETEETGETRDPMDESSLVLFNTGKGLTLKMSPDVEEHKNGDHSVYYFSEECMVSVKMVGFEELEEDGTGNADTTLEEYIKIVESNNEDITFTEDDYGNPSVVYSAEKDKERFTYYSTVRKGSEAFWLVNFSCMEEDQDKMLPQFELWGSTITVK